MKTPLAKMTPDQVCSWIRAEVRRRWGNRIENATNIYASHGYYYFRLPGKQLVVSRRSALRKHLREVLGP